MEKQLLQLNYNLNTIGGAVKKFWEMLHQYHVLAFSGEMGAGKTTFIHELCTHLKVQDTVSSPTFALINEYHFNDNSAKDQIIYHLDWYRLRSTEEAISAGMEDCLLRAQKGMAYCFIEWPEKAPELLQPPYVKVSIETMADISEREMKVTLIK